MSDQATRWEEMRKKAAEANGVTDLVASLFAPDESSNDKIGVEDSYPGDSKNGLPDSVEDCHTCFMNLQYLSSDLLIKLKEELDRIEYSIPEGDPGEECMDNGHKIDSDEHSPEERRKSVSHAKMLSKGEAEFDPKSSPDILQPTIIFLNNEIWGQIYSELKQVVPEAFEEESDLSEGQ